MAQAKSTLIKILSGAYLRDAGEIYIDSLQIQSASTRRAHENGVSVIYQEFALAPHLSVAENIFIDSLGDSRGFIRWKQLKTRTDALLQRLGFSDIDALAPVSDLSVAYQQVVEICKALTRESKVLVLDEPTAVLTHSEIDKLFDVILELKTKGVCIIYVSHRLEEIFRLCDRITVLKDGKLVNTVAVSDVDRHSLIEMMIGREMKDLFPDRNAQIGDVVLRVEELNVKDKVQNVSFVVRKGEVLGISGLVGAGRTETARAIFGADKKDSGRVFLDGEEVFIKTPRDSVALGIGMLPEDRKQHGVILDLPIRTNGTLTIIDRITGLFGSLDRKTETITVDGLVDKLRLKAASIDASVHTLSGGNQQKVALMKWLAKETKVLILDEPTRGVDVGAKVEIYRTINELAAQGIGIVLISSEMPEVIGMCDRVIVMRRGRVTRELGKADLNEMSLIKPAMGVHADE
jgi:ribose transport system ATP-binding protein